jgi:hypothetical protein
VTNIGKTDISKRIEAAWPGAVARWSAFLVLDDPALDAAQDAIAQINLSTRCVSLNGSRIADMGVEDCIPAMLAHEVGHHVAYPATLQVQARLCLIERTMAPFPEYSVVNRFTDLMINERLGQTDLRLRAQMIKIYQVAMRRNAVSEDDLWKLDPSFIFYLALYEALWELEEGDILGPVAGPFRRRFPHYRAEAEVLTQEIFVLGPNLYTQFLYFLSLSLRYLLPVLPKSDRQPKGDDDDEDNDEALPAPVSADGKGCNCGDPTPSDWAQAMTPTQAERDAIRRAIKDGWFNAKGVERLSRALDINERMSGLPGMGAVDSSQVPEVMAAYYRQQAERLLFRPPAQPRIGEAVLPSTLEDWTPADPVRDIDWLTTLLLRGDQAGVALPLKRLYEAEVEGEEVRFHQTKMEIYLDVSGSMPNPCLDINPMTLAAQILTTATARSGGRVRLALYSHTTIRHWEWSRSEREISGFLMHYIGGGTDYPFELLEESTRECAGAQPIRVIITDSDFDCNVEACARSMAILRETADASPGLILLQLGEESPRAREYRGVGVSVVPVTEFNNYPKVARDLAWALFPELAHEAR